MAEWLNEASGIKLINNKALSTLGFQHSLAEIYTGHLAHSALKAFHLLYTKTLLNNLKHTTTSHCSALRKHNAPHRADPSNVAGRTASE